MNRLACFSLGLVLLSGCSQKDAPPDPPPDPPEESPQSEPSSTVTSPSSEAPAPTDEPALAEPNHDVTLKTIPPYTTEPSVDGTRRAVIEQSAYAAYCAAADLPEPPAGVELDHISFGLIHSAIQTAATTGTNASLSRLAMMYDGNGMPARAAACYQLLLQRSPDDARWWHLMGRCLAIQSNHGEAVAAFERANRIDSTNSATLARLGNALLAMDRIDDALAAFRGANILLPNEKAALFGLARIASEREQWDEAHQYLQQVLAINPQFKPALQQMVIVQRSRGDIDDARRCMELANRIPEGGNTEPHDPLIQEVMRTSQSTAYYKGLMKALFAARRYPEAYDTILKILERQPELALYQRNAASLAKLNGDLDAAITHAQRAVALNPEYTKGHTVLGELLRDVGRIDEAIAETAKAVELDPDDPTNHLSHGAVLVSAKQYDIALEQLDLGLAGAPNHITGLRLRVQCLAEMNRLDEAKTTLERILKLEPTNPWALRIKKQLR